MVVGARSALFAPFEDLGLLVVDEEHDDSYKQEDGVRYNARDMAVVLGRSHGCPVVLASATPGLESWQNATTGRYTLLELPDRATSRPVPEITVVDLTEIDRPDEGPPPLLAPPVEAALRRTFAADGKAIILYNRRGYATMVQCVSCGGRWECPNCGITMTYHRRARVMACHYCGLKRPYSATCTACGGTEMMDLGLGTERVEEALQASFPGIPRWRMDADTTSVRGSHHRILTAFREPGAAMLIGTQIVAKGHDFPDVHTAVVISADHGFRMPDFRASERTCALLVQVAGRAGRGDVAGEVFVQTWSSDHYVLQHLDGLRDFYEVELRLRLALKYPPYHRLALVRIDGVDRRATLDVARAIGQGCRGGASRYPGVEVLGPAAAALPQLVGRWRFQVILRGEQVRAFREFLKAVAPDIERAGRKGIRVSIDVDPRSLL